MDRETFREQLLVVMERKDHVGLAGFHIGRSIQDTSTFSF